MCLLSLSLLIQSAVIFGGCMETNNPKSSVINWWAGLSKKSKGWIIGITVCLILAFIGYLADPSSFSENWKKSNPKNSGNQTTTNTQVNENKDNSKYSSWKEGYFQGVSYMIPPNFKEQKKTDDNGQPVITLTNEKGRVYNFELAKNAISSFGSFADAAAIALVSIKDVYFKEMDVNFITDKIYSIDLGSQRFVICPSDKTFLNVFFGSKNDDLYYVIAVSDNLNEAKQFAESIEIP